MGSTKAIDRMEWYRYKGPLRDAQGKLPRGCPWNRHWGLSQGELHLPYGYPRVSIDYAIALIELNNGRWITRPERGRDHTYTVRAAQYESREAALRVAVASVVRMARAAVRRPRTRLFLSGSWTLTLELAEDVIRWALAMLGKDPPAAMRLTSPAPPAPARRHVKPAEQSDLFEGTVAFATPAPAPQQGGEP